MPPQDLLPQVITDLLRESNAAAKQKDYDTALRAISEGLQLLSDNHGSVSKHTITLLDYRHAIHVRKDDLDSALKDAKSMIRLDRKDARGYIRCGHVESLRDHKAAALAYLKHGLRNVSPSDPNLGLLKAHIKKIDDDITDALMRSNAQDPLSALPLEIIEMVLSYVTHRQHVQMLQVCRSWKRLLSEMPPLTDTVAFPGAKKPISPRMLLAALRRLKVPKAVHVRQLMMPSSDLLQGRLLNGQKFDTLESFKMDDPKIQLHALPLLRWNLKTLVLESGSPCESDWVCDLLKSSPRLQSAQFYSVVAGSPTHLILHSQSLVELVYISKSRYESRGLSVCMPRIKRLQIQGIQWFYKDPPVLTDLQPLEELHTFVLRHCRTTNLLLPASIRHLEIQDCVFVYSGPMLRQPATSFPPLSNLKTLSLRQCRGEIQIRQERLPLTPNCPEFIVQAAAKTEPGSLSALMVAQDQGLEHGQTLMNMLRSPWFNGLTSLDISGVRLTDEDSAVLTASCPDLETLSVGDNLLTAVFLADMISAPTSKLRHVTVGQCPKMGRDIIPWAEKRGVHVRFTTSIALAKAAAGRAVRESY